MNRDAISIYVADQFFKVRSLDFGRPTSMVFLAVGESSSLTLADQPIQVSLTKDALIVGTGAGQGRFEHKLVDIASCSVMPTEGKLLTTCINHDSYYGAELVGIVDPRHPGPIENLFNPNGAQLLGWGDCIERDHENPVCVAQLGNQKLLVRGSAGDGVGSNLLLLDVLSAEGVLPFSTSMVPEVGSALRTRPTVKPRYTPYFDNLYRLKTVPNADCYTWVQPSAYAEGSILGRSLILVKGTVEIECMRYTGGPMEHVKSLTAPVTWYFEVG
jgi:hypothetical protein